MKDEIAFFFFQMKMGFWDNHFIINSQLVYSQQNCVIYPVLLLPKKWRLSQEESDIQSEQQRTLSQKAKSTFFNISFKSQDLQKFQNLTHCANSYMIKKYSISSPSQRIGFTSPSTWT